jgi:penicillin amidase
VDLGILDLSSSHSLEEALIRANHCGAPHQNVVIADDKGRIGWTILGKMPRRRPGFSGRLPSSWADRSKGWDGYREPSEYPRLVDPPSGQLWTANPRVADGEIGDKIGDGGPDRGRGRSRSATV